MDLARELSALAAHVEWPPTPELQARARAARRAATPPRPLVLALAALAVAIAAAFAVPQSRGAILRFFHLGAATIVTVDRLPAAEERPLAAGIGPVVSLAEAKQAFRGALLVPRLDPLPPAHVVRALGRVVRLLLPRGTGAALRVRLRRGLLQEARRRAARRSRAGTSRAILRSGSPGRPTTSTSRTPRRVLRAMS